MLGVADAVGTGESDTITARTNAATAVRAATLLITAYPL